MKKIKYIKAGLIVVFLILAGIIYSCLRAESNPNKSVIGTPINLGENSTTIPQTESEIKQEDGETSSSIPAQEEDNTVSDTQQPEETASSIPDPGSTVSMDNMVYYVHLCGAVKNPGVYEADKATRVYELIKSAGGFTKGADENYVNQAATVEDGQQIYIPTKEEVLKGTVSGAVIEKTGTAQADNAADSYNTTGRININIATKSELCTLPGIGEVKAESIITYRTNHGKFQNIEELKQIEGIKDAVYNKIKDMIEAK